ncbi:MBL fold metallo-hydrolase [Thalassobaculum fulvum]|uniref:MBL fold metallo-hydrolase n=1 Tax=Thalassobaculum fulvum TaxID=1633335 RepID=A0A919CMT5_9PROT|nr:MBL fold metallo-hydrolase [Thalassobaculum fulvum]GHD41176.1 MBL fold metallo-hydrolase [Thalassobaculum fulvum]
MQSDSTTEAPVTAGIRRSAGRSVATDAGGYRVVALCDGHVDFDLSRLPGVALDDALPVAAPRGVDARDLAVSVNAFAVVGPDRLYLVDSGNGTIRGPGLGHLLQAMAAAGLRPEDVDAVLMTHMHGDHVAGLYDGDRSVFPNAEMIVSEAERAFWDAPEQLSELQRGQLDMARKGFATHSGRTTIANPGAEVVPGITMVALPGHTPGHVGYRIDGSDPLLIWGDVVHLPALQMARPDWYFVFDVDPETAVATRRRILDEVATDGIRVTGAHVPFPGFARIERAGGGYLYRPTDESL